MHYAAAYLVGKLTRTDDIFFGLFGLDVAEAIIFFFVRHVFSIAHRQKTVIVIDGQSFAEIAVSIAMHNHH